MNRLAAAVGRYAGPLLIITISGSAGFVLGVAAASPRPDFLPVTHPDSPPVMREGPPPEAVGTPSGCLLRKGPAAGRVQLRGIRRGVH